MNKINRAQGFTLIELLVVIAIIGLLSSIVYASLGSARAKARDAKRLADRKQVITALNLYYSEYTVWPTSSGGSWSCLAPGGERCWPNGGQWINGQFEGSNDLMTAMKPYIASFPTNNADAGNFAYNRMLYASNIPANGFDPNISNPAGAYLVWVQENNLPASSCPSPLVPAHMDKYWYCYEYLGPP